MNKEEIKKRLSALWINGVAKETIEEFIFEEVLPEVLQNVLRGEFITNNEMYKLKMEEGKNECLLFQKQRAKSLYNIIL